MLKGNQSFLTNKGNGDEWDIRSLLMRRDGQETSSTFGSKCLIPYRNARQKFVPCKKPISPASFLHSIQDHLTCGISIANFKVMISRTNTIFFWEQQIHCQHVSPFNTFFLYLIFVLTYPGLRIPIHYLGKKLMTSFPL